MKQRSKSEWFKFGGPIGRGVSPVGWKGQVVFWLFILILGAGLYFASTMHSVLTVILVILVWTVLFVKVMLMTGNRSKK